MVLKPLQRFQHFTTHHCVTGSMRHIYVHNDHHPSEDVLLGVGLFALYAVPKARISNREI